MLLTELFESVTTTSSALDQLLFNANNMYTLYADILPDRVSNMYAKGEHEDMERTVKNVVGRTKGKWFADNYLSTSTRRDSPTTGLKNALLALAKDPAFSSVQPRLKELGSFVIMTNAQKQYEKFETSSGQYVTKLESLPDVLNALAPRAPGNFRDRLKTVAHRLSGAIDRFYTMWGKLHAEWERDWGTPDPDQLAKEERKRQETSKKVVAGSQASAVEGIVNQVLSSVDKRIAAELRPILARSDNKLVTLQQELTKRGIKI